MSTIMQQMEKIQKLTEDMVREAGELNEASSKMLYDINGIEDNQE